MTAIDWVLLAIVAISALLGLMRGFVGVVLSLLSWALAGAVAYGFGDDAAVMLSDVANPGVGYVVGGYALCFGSVLVTVKLLSWFIRRVLESVGLSGMDRGLGLMFGVLRGALFACVLVLLMGFTSLPGDAQWRRSQTIPVFEPGARWLRDLLPVAIAQQVSFDGAGPLSTEGLRQQSRALSPLAGGGGMLGQDTQALLRSLGGPSADDGRGAIPAGQALPLPLPDLESLRQGLESQGLEGLQGLDGLEKLEGLMPRAAGQSPRQGDAGAPAVDPANVDAAGPGGSGGQPYDPAAVDGPASRPSRQPGQP